MYVTYSIINLLGGEKSMKNEMSIGKATGLFIVWEIVYTLIFSLIEGGIGGVLLLVFGNENVVNIINIIPDIIFQFLILKFAIWNTLKKESISSYLERQFLISICIIYIIVSIFPLFIDFNVVSMFGSLIGLAPLLFAKKYIEQYNN